jgi:hypothetical protein
MHRMAVVPYTSCTACAASGARVARAHGGNTANPQENDRLRSFIAAARSPQREGLRLLLAIARRPRGAALLARAAPLDQLPRGLLTVGHYDDPEVGRSLGWDVDAVVARGRELRRARGRP